MRTVRFRDNGDELAVGKILCVGQNYAKHVEEMQGRMPTEPMLFFKPATAIVREGAAIVLPPFTSDVHHEVELVLVIGKDMRHVGEDDVASHLAGYAVGLDLTARDIQRKAKKEGKPWAIAKGFDGSAPVSDVCPAGEAEPADLLVELRVNGELRQSGRTSDMIFGIPKLLSFMSSIFTLERGDLIFTGTPSGVASLAAGDLLEASVENVAAAQWVVEA